MEKFEKLDNEQKDLIKYWIEKFRNESPLCFTDSEIKFIEKHLTPEPGIEVGKWYKSPENKFMIFVEEYNPVAKMIIGYGFNSSGYWFNKTKTSYYKLEKATPEEYEPRLIELAESKYKKGDTIVYGDRKPAKIIGDIYFAEGCGLVSVQTDNNSSNENPFYPLMQDGKWAEIIDEKAELKATIAKLRTELSTLEAQL